MPLFTNIFPMLFLLQHISASRVISSCSAQSRRVAVAVGLLVHVLHAALGAVLAGRVLSDRLGSRWLLPVRRHLRRARHADSYFFRVYRAYVPDLRSAVVYVYKSLLQNLVGLLSTPTIAPRTSAIQHVRRRTLVSRPLIGGFRHRSLDIYRVSV